MGRRPMQTTEASTPALPPPPPRTAAPAPPRHHAPARFSAEPLDRPSPVSLWRDGDVIVDEFAVTLPPHFSSGSYELYWGAGVLPCSDDRRMHVTKGPR